ncbi:hypothetical protein GCM10027586_17060 [Kineococcus gypseus]|uniref:hypothetical protein n=1 Tax=Kineococcus gypseus TaxID=1637102 RepID=UPI003D7D444E
MQRAERAGLGSLQPVPEGVEAAGWILAAVRDFDHTVGSLVPPLFAAYARVFHPARLQQDTADARDAVQVSWAQVAAANARRAHAGMQWTSITGSWRHHHGGATQPGVWDTEPEEGTLPAAQAQALVDVLTRFTTTPECFYAVWDGFGALDVPLEAQLVGMPGRDMRLLRGPLAEAAGVSMESPPWQQSPSLWWPADRTWCVATDVDLMSTYLGASEACIEAVLAAADLEAWPVTDRQGLTWDSDHLNPLPPQPT